MFGTEDNNKKFSSSGSHNHFAAGTIINGEVHSEGDIRIEGKIVGVVVSKSKIAVGATGIIEGDVQCKNADIDGKIKGKLVIQGLLHLKKTAVVEGDIFYGTLAVEEGAVLRGNCGLVNSSEAKPLNYNNERREETKETPKKEAV